MSTATQFSAAQWIGRAVAGLAFGWIWSALVSLAWVGLGLIAYGDFDRALVRLKDGPGAPVAQVGLFASLAASFVGGVVGPLAAGRRGRSVWRSSARGGACGTVLGVVAGLLVGWAGGPSDPQARALAALGLGVLAGLIGGWLGGWASRCTGSGTAPDRDGT